MKTQLRKLFWRLGEKTIFVPWAANLIYFLVRVLKRFPLRYREHGTGYDTVGSRWGTHPGLYGDRSANFFIRAVLESRPRYLIELGAFDGWRSMTLARLFPALKVYALDINPDFSERKQITDNLVIAPNTLATIQSISKENDGLPGLLCSTGTLCYYSTADLVAVLTVARKSGMTLALDEPNVSITETTRTTPMRRMSSSWYHPWAFLLRNAGFTVHDDNAMQQDHTWGVNIEERNCIYATPVK